MSARLGAGCSIAVTTASAACSLTASMRETGNLPEDEKTVTTDFGFSATYSGRGSRPGTAVSKFGVVMSTITAPAFALPAICAIEETEMPRENRSVDTLRFGVHRQEIALTARRGGVANQECYREIGAC